MATAIAEREKVGDPQMVEPRKGERYCCQKCGMEIEITEDCKTTAGHHVRFECCGQPLTRE